MRILDAPLLRMLERVRLNVMPSATGADQGGHRSLSRKGGIEFAEHRPYVPGDDVRHIDWKAFARRRQLVVRQYSEERDARVYVLVDVSGSMARGAAQGGEKGMIKTVSGSFRMPSSKLEAARVLATSLAFVGARQFDRVRVVPFSGDLSARNFGLRLIEDLPALERNLIDLSPEGETDFRTIARSFAKTITGRGIVIIVSDLMTLSGFDEAVRYIAAAGHQVLVVRMAALEDDSPKLGGEIELVDSETQERIQVRMSKQLLDAYKAEVATHLDTCEREVVRVGGRYISVSLPLDDDVWVREVFGAARAA